MKKYIKLSVALCALLASGMAMAADQTWINLDGDQDWFNAGNWDNGEVPTSAFETHINQAGVPGPIVSTVGAATGRIVLDNESSLVVTAGGNLNNSGDHVTGNYSGSVNNATTVSGTYSVGTEFGLGMANGGGTLTVNSGGTVNANGEWLVAGHGDGGSGAITVDGGTLNVANLLYIGNLGDGVLTVNSGIVSVASILNIALAPTSTGLVEVNGGVLTVDGLNAGHIDGSATIDLTGGQIINTAGFVQNANSVFNIGAGELVFTDFTIEDVNTIIDYGGGTWNFSGANGNVRSVTDDGLGNITVTAIPEPATMGLMALFGGAVLGFRRMFS